MNYLEIARRAGRRAGRIPPALASEKTFPPAPRPAPIAPTAEPLKAVKAGTSETRPCPECGAQASEIPRGPRWPVSAGRSWRCACGRVFGEQAAVLPVRLDPKTGEAGGPHPCIECSVETDEAHLRCGNCWGDRLRRSSWLCGHPLAFYDHEARRLTCALCEWPVRRSGRGFVSDAVIEFEARMADAASRTPDAHRRTP
jgi:hypothetical protein